MKSIISFFIVVFASLNAFAGTFAVQGNQFMLNGQPFRIISGEMHYARIPHEDWRARLQAAHAMGLNTISTYVFWNRHEAQQGVYDFKGDNDIAEFIREAQQEGLYVLLRPGPYVCAEWEFGGFPAWLLRDPSTVVRSNDAKFMDPVRAWMKRLGQELSPLTIAKGGPILAVQVENEYGAIGEDQAYIEAVRSAVVDGGLNDVLLYTSDGAGDLGQGEFPDLLATVNFGAGHARESIAALQKYRTSGPVMVGEFWDGWFDGWGGKHANVAVAPLLDDLHWMLQQGISLNFYMFHGGTNFGETSGADGDGTGLYFPYVTSYDYDSPLDESGRPTAKFFAIRDAITAETGTTPPALTALPVPITTPAFQSVASVSLWDSVGDIELAGANSTAPIAMEQLGQSSGVILYQAALPATGLGAKLQLLGLNDFAEVYIDGVNIGSLDRRIHTDTLVVPASIRAGAELKILVQNSGRINYSVSLRDERKGVSQVLLNGAPITNWMNHAIPLDDLSALQFKSQACSGPCFYRSTFNLTSVPADTFLDTKSLGKGIIWINGHKLGRFWKIGPQRTLFVPGVWLKLGSNDVTIFDLEGSPDWQIQGLDHPILNETAP